MLRSFSGITACVPPVTHRDLGVDSSSAVVATDAYCVPENHRGYEACPFHLDINPTSSPGLFVLKPWLFRVTMLPVLGGIWPHPLVYKGLRALA